MKKYVILLLCFFAVSSFLFASEIFSVADFKNDDGKKLVISFDESFLGAESIQIFRSFDGEDYDKLVVENPTSNTLVDELPTYIKSPVYYILIVENGEMYEEHYASATPKAQWFNTDKTAMFILLIVLCSAVIFYIIKAGRGDDIFIRKINGLEAMDEAVGRATEMGRPVLFVPGISDISDMQTLAGVTILGKLAEKVAEYHTKIIVPCRNSLVMTAARDIVKASYLKAGCPDEFNPDDIFYLTDDQFGYVAGIDGIIVREKPAANFLLGAFWAESLIIAETGFAAKSIQIAGTAMPSQIPFFVAACDYTLIGEELFAASAYLSKHPQQLGSLKGQDFGKLIVIALIVLGVILEMSNISLLKMFLKV